MNNNTNTSLLCPDEYVWAYEGEDSCPPVHDSIMCWPRTAPGSWATIRCFAEFRGKLFDATQNATKWCWPNGTWQTYSNYTPCQTNILKSIEDNKINSELTSQIYQIGYGISLATLLIAVIIHLYFRELRCLRNTIHTNLMFTYILYDLLWIVNSMQISMQFNIPTCIVFYSLLHYFQLTNYFWMFVEGLYLYMLVVKTFSGDHIKLNMCLFIGWGIPFIIVVFWGTFRSLMDIDPETMKAEDLVLAMHCPLMIRHPLDWVYQIASLAVLGINVLFLFMIMWVLITKLRSATNAETQQYRKAAKALLVLIPLLGITYMLVLIGPDEGPAAKIFQNARAVLLSTQGLSVAVFYCFLNSEVRNTLRHHYERWVTERSLGAGQRYYAHWAPRSRTESVRLHCRPDDDGPANQCRNNNSVNGSSQHAQDACTVSEATTTTIFTPKPNHSNSNNHSSRFFGRFKKNHM